MNLQHHEPVLTQEIEEIFREKKIKTFFDGTLGAGGHASHFLTNHPEIEKYIGLDQDPTALKIAKVTLQPWGEKVRFLQGNFAEIGKVLKKEKVSCLDGCLLDIGVSSMQLNNPERGFSFQREGPLDMRMSPSLPLTAKEIVNTFSEKKLGEIFLEFGEEPRWKRAAAIIVQERRKKKFETTIQLAQILEKNLKRMRKIHPATLVFQALRIYVNQELEVLKTALEQGTQLLCEGGMMAVITFHSLEDRLVKNHFRQACKEDEGLHLLTKKPLTAQVTEIRGNPRSRSAKLRVIERVKE